MERANLQCPLQVVKIGGSLLQFEALFDRLIQWELDQRRFSNIYVVGGGKVIDEIRRLDRFFDFGESASHIACLDVMSINARLVSTKTNWPVISDVGQLAQSTLFPVLFDLRNWQPAVEDCSWNTSSDSLAATLAVYLGASRLTLLKSTSVDSDSVEVWTTLGIVDEHFAQRSRHIESVRIHSLRSSL